MRNFILMLAVVGCGGGSDKATIEYTDYGIPHVTADTFEGLGRGMGYAVSRDHGCVIADQLVMIRGERSKYFGPGDASSNINSDFGWRSLDVVSKAAARWDELEPRIQDQLNGYAKGYNDWVEEGEYPDACAGADWVTTTTGEEILGHAFGASLRGSGQVFSEEIGAAQPPNQPQRVTPGRERWEAISNVLFDPGRGSNGWAIGGDRTANGKGGLLSNTHYPAVDEAQWHEIHLTVPGELDVYGVALVGIPVVNMGFTEFAAWTHTVSFAPRFTAYFVELDPENPTRYRYGDEFKDMVPTEYEIEVKGQEPRKRTLWDTHYGPMIDAPIIGWPQNLGVTFRDANEDNLAIVEAWYGMNFAQSNDEFVAANLETQGIPWVYTMAAFPDGELYFADSSRVPYLDEGTIQRWEQQVEEDFITGTFADFGVIALQGSDPRNEWLEVAESRFPGLIPPNLAPTDRRRDYAFNANDSHWLHNVEEPLTGFIQQLYGPEETPRSGRTRMNGRYLSDTGAGSASGEDGKFTLDEIESAALSMRSITAEDALPDISSRCATLPDAMVDGSIVDISDSCDALSGWSGRYTSDAEGAVLWREMMGDSTIDDQDLNAAGGGLFSTPWSATDPVNTPRDVSILDQDLADLIARAQVEMEDAGWSMSDPLGDHQYMLYVDGSTAPVGGANYWEGTIAIADFSSAAGASLLPKPERGEVLDDRTKRTADGYPMNNGNSWIMAMTFEDSGPVGRAVMTYSQSEDPNSPHFQDQADLYTQGAMREIWFTREDVEAHITDTITLK